MCLVHNTLTGFYLLTSYVCIGCVKKCMHGRYYIAAYFVFVRGPPIIHMMCSIAQDITAVLSEVAYHLHSNAIS